MHVVVVVAVVAAVVVAAVVAAAVVAAVVALIASKDGIVRVAGESQPGWLVNPWGSWQSHGVISWWCAPLKVQSQCTWEASWCVFHQSPSCQTPYSS